MEEAFGTDIVTLLQDGFQHIIYIMLYAEGHDGLPFPLVYLGHAFALQGDACLCESLCPSRLYAFHPVQAMSSHGSVVIIPAPSPSVGQHFVGRHQFA